MDDGDPLLSAFDHVFKLHAGPELRRQPIWDFGSDHAQNRDSYASFFYDSVGFEIGSPIGFYGICADYWRLQLLIELVVDCMASLDVMVANTYSIISEEINRLRPDMGTIGLFEVIIINCRLSLERIAIFKEYYLGIWYRSFLFNEARYLCKRCSGWLCGDEIVRVNRAMNIASFDECQID